MSWLHRPEVEHPGLKDPLTPAYFACVCLSCCQEPSTLERQSPSIARRSLGESRCNRTKEEEPMRVTNSSFLLGGEGQGESNPMTRQVTLQQPTQASREQVGPSQTQPPPIPGVALGPGGPVTHKPGARKREGRGPGRARERTRLLPRARARALRGGRPRLPSGRGGPEAGAMTGRAVPGRRARGGPDAAPQRGAGAAAAYGGGPAPARLGPALTSG